MTNNIKNSAYQSLNYFTFTIRTQKAQFPIGREINAISHWPREKRYFPLAERKRYFPLAERKMLFPIGREKNAISHWPREKRYSLLAENCVKRTT
jgi:hypothetical protein